MISPIRTVRRLLSRLYLLILLPAFALALLLALWSAAFYQVSQERAAALREAVAASQSLARTLADHTSFILRQTDHATQLFKLKFEESEGTLRLNEFTRPGGLLDSVLPSKLDPPIALIGADGAVIDSVNAFMPDDMTDSAFFKAHMASPSETPLFGTPVLEPRTQKWLIRTSRRLNDYRGRFAGVIVIMLEPSYFVDDYDRLNVDDAGALMLLTRDTGLTVGRVGERLIISDKLDFGAPAGAQHPPEQLAISEPFDQVARIYSYRETPRYPLLAVVGIAERVAMANFEQRRRLYFGAVAAATLLIAAFTGLLMRQQRRLRHSTRAASEAQSMLRAAAHGSLDAVFLLKAWRPAGPGRAVEDFLIADTNERGADMLGKPRADVLGQKACQLLPMLRQPSFFGEYLAVLESGQPREGEFEVRLASGAKRWLQHQIVAIDDGVAVTTRDISARKQDELETRNNRAFLQSLIEHLPVLVYVKSARPETFGQMVVWNQAAESVTGYAAAAVVGKSDSAAFAPDSGLRDDGADQRLLAQRSVVEVPDKPLRRPDGALRHLHTVSVPLFDQQGQTEYILCIGEDVSLRLRHEQTLRENQAELAAVTDASPLGLVRLGASRQCSYVNRTFESITGLAREAALGAGWLAAVHPDDQARMAAALERLERQHLPFQLTLRGLHRDGRVVWLAVKFAAILVGEAVAGYVGSFDDITVVREAEVALLESEARLRTIADTLPAMIAYVDAEQVYRFHNIAYEREFSRTGQHVLGQSVRDTVGEAHYRTLQPYIARVLRGETLSFEEDDESDGAERCTEVNYIPQYGENSDIVVGFHVMRQDITIQKREKQRLLKLTQVDALTGLTNRAGFLQKLSDAMQHCQESHSLMAVMYMDIDRFKPVNDTYGHSVGDALLRAFSARLTHTMRASDTIARLGGDEFTIIMEKIARPEDASVLAAKIVTAMQAPFDLDGIDVGISASIGLAYYRNEDLTPAALLKQADMLLYQAKQGGRNTYRAGALVA
ncbi:diguanylate cyclase domain-containing protein [Janthinobacterium fluminis]|uniref:Diguanylate cyclase n=1 Tax=Janthinobacterium fluminis TaxID=2987524 RepID=A0ABT5K0N0_9BURK|nr:diguanylate cyclase [Janthinobacterium fluminis]MDC8758479.1 diguanylate cyclase [Janthinobacterium fluminis]